MDRFFSVIWYCDCNVIVNGGKASLYKHIYETNERWVSFQALFVLSLCNRLSCLGAGRLVVSAFGCRGGEVSSIWRLPVTSFRFRHCSGAVSGRRCVYRLEGMWRGLSSRRWTIIKLIGLRVVGHSWTISSFITETTFHAKNQNCVG